MNIEIKLIYHIAMYLRAIVVKGAVCTDSDGHLQASARTQGVFDFCFVSIYKWVTYKIIKVLISSLKTALCKSCFYSTIYEV